MTKFKVSVLYIFFALAVALVFLYYLFPEQEAIRRVTDQFEHAYPPDRITIQRLRPVPLATLRVQGVRIDGRGGVNFQISRMDFSPRLLRLLGGRLFVDYSGSAYGGTFSGQIDFGDTQWDTAKQVTLSMTHLQLHQVLMGQAATVPALRGTVDGEAVYHPLRKSGDTATGKLVLTHVTLTLPGLSGVAATLNFSNVSTAFTVAPPVVNLEHSQFTGPQADGVLTGSLRIGQPLPQSQLSLTLKVSLHQAYRNRLAQALPMLMSRNGRDASSSYHFKILGTLEKPEISLFP